MCAGRQALHPAHPTTDCAGKLFQTLGVALPPHIRAANPEADPLAKPAEL